MGYDYLMISVSGVQLVNFQAGNSFINQQQELEEKHREERRALGLEAGNGEMEMEMPWGGPTGNPQCHVSPQGTRTYLDVRLEVRING